MTAPPVVDRLIYSQTLPNIAHRAVPLEAGLIGATNQELYELRWQPDALFHRQLLSSSGWGTDQIPGRCFTLWSNHFYFLDAGTKPALYVLEQDKAGRGEYPGPFHAAHVRMVEAFEPLELGLSHIFPGMARWNGDAFCARTMADRKPMWIDGRISRFSNGVPVEVRVAYSNDVGIANYRITYDFTSDNVAPYPTRIASYFQNGPREILYSEWFILSIATSDRPLSESRFVPPSWHQTLDSRLLYLTNDSMYAQLPSGRLVEVPAGISWADSSKHGGSKGRWTFAAAAVFWTFLCAWFGIRAGLCSRVGNSVNS